MASGVAVLGVLDGCGDCVVSVWCVCMVCLCGVIWCECAVTVWCVMSVWCCVYVHVVSVVSIY